MPLPENSMVWLFNVPMSSSGGGADTLSSTVTESASCVLFTKRTVVPAGMALDDVKSRTDMPATTQEGRPVFLNKIERGQDFGASPPPPVAMNCPLLCTSDMFLFATGTNQYAAPHVPAPAAMFPIKSFHPLVIQNTVG